MLHTTKNVLLISGLQTFWKQKHRGLLVLCVGHMRVVWAEDLQLDIERLLVHGQGLLWLTLLVEHVSDAA